MRVTEKEKLQRRALEQMVCVAARVGEHEILDRFWWNDRSAGIVYVGCERLCVLRRPNGERSRRNAESKGDGEHEPTHG
jgi:hypothetical protein